MPKIDELVDDVAAQILIDFIGEFSFTNLDLKYAYIQLLLDNYTSNQCSFILVENNITGTYQLFSGYYELVTCQMNSKKSWTQQSETSRSKIVTWVTFWLHPKEAS